MGIRESYQYRLLMDNPSSNDLPLSLYIHFPWCVKKCPYCDFNSHQLKGEIDEKRYIDALKQDLLNDLDGVENRRLQSIFLGGGTPSLFSGESIGELLDHIKQKIGSAPDLEVTLEANPGTLEHRPFESYLSAGINRLSLGVQSLNNDSLQTLGRIHNADNARQAIKQAQASGFENINLDFMFGLPNQQIHNLLEEIDQILEFQTSHISFYQLTLEPNTLFHRYPPTLPNDDELVGMQDALSNRLSLAGFERYEVSAYAKNGSYSKHNINYWQFGDYLGIGAGAHSKITSSKGINREWKEKRPDSYLQKIEGNAISQNSTRVTHPTILFEYMLNALRLKLGFDLDQCEKRTGVSVKTVIDSLTKPKQLNLIQIDDNRVSCTEKGYLFIDEILQDLLP
jgi:putative oxygen-independent coproporphyrinogen III oxidase